MCALAITILYQISKMAFINRYVEKNEIDIEIERIRMIESMNEYADNTESDTKEHTETGSMTEQRADTERKEPIESGSTIE